MGYSFKVEYNFIKNRNIIYRVIILYKKDFGRWKMRIKT